MINKLLKGLRAFVIHRSVGAKVVAVVSLFAVFIAADVWVTAMTLTKQAHDGRVINVSGSQRMRVLQILHEAHKVLHGAPNGENLTTEVAIFDVTLKGLISGDPFLEVPAATDRDVLDGLAGVENLWGNYKLLATSMADLAPHFHDALAQALAAIGIMEDELGTVRDLAGSHTTTTLVGRTLRQLDFLEEMFLPMPASFVSNEAVATVVLEVERATADLVEFVASRHAEDSPVGLALSRAEDQMAVAASNAIMAARILPALRDAMVEMDTRTEGLLQIVNAVVTAQERVSGNRLQNLLRFQYLSLGAGLVLFVAVGIMLRGVVVAPLRQIAQSFRSVAHGDFSAHFDENYEGNEMVHLRDAFHALVKTLVEQRDKLKTANSRLSEEASTDWLTNLNNRRTFHAHLQQQLQLALRNGQPITLFMVDLDNFKMYNDEFGHLAGDDALKTSAELLESSVRGSDLVARYGGEEFAVLLPETAQAGAIVRAERIRAVFEGRPWAHRQVTASVGVATLQIADQHSVIPIDEVVETLIADADAALYRAKDEGRNRVCHNEVRTELGSSINARKVPRMTG